MKTITREELVSRLNSPEPPIVVEALPARYFEEAHIPGALNIPDDEINQQAPARLPDKQATVVVYCASTRCKNSEIAARALDALGYSNVYEYVEGKEDWQAAGLPLESGPGVSAAAA